MTAQNVNITSLLYPNSIAITGATSNPEDLGSYILRNIIFSQYKGRMFPINQKLSQLYEFDTYDSIREITEEIDLAILTTPADRIIDDVYDCTRASVKNICIATSGFAENGSSGFMLQKKIAKMANEAGIRVLGPNSLGIISTAKSLNASFSPSLPQAGKAVFISQSGALINALLEYSQFYSLGLAEIIGLGNKADICEIDFLKYYSTLRSDGQPYVLGCYLESISDGKEFIEVAQKFTKDIPLVALIPSESPKTREYIYSHSGSILQKDEVIDLALAQSGAIKVYTQQQLYDLMLAFSWQTAPRGNNVAVISNAGGGLILAIEQIYRKGLKVVNFSTEVKKMLITELDWKGQNSGVVDLGGEALSLNYLKALDIVLGDYDVNAVVVILSPQVMTQIEESAEVIGRLAKEHGKTIIAAFMGYEGVEKGIKALGKYFIPAFNSVDRAVFVLSKMHQYANLKEQGGGIVTKFSYHEPIERDRSMKVLEMIEQARINKNIELRLDECLKILRIYEVKVGNIKQIKSLKDVLKFGKEKNYPIEFYCTKSKKGKSAYDRDQVRKIYEDHFKINKASKDHKFSDHLIKKLYKGKKNFRILIQKDTYYEHIDKGFTLKELEKLSFGQLFEIKLDGANLSKSVKALLPLDRDKVESCLVISDFIGKFGFKSGVRYEKLKKDMVALMRKVCQIPQDFPQILWLSVNCLVDKGNIVIVNCRIKLDMMI